MEDWTDKSVVVINDDSEQFEALKTDLSNFGLCRTVGNWNICRENAKHIYSLRVIEMLDASGFIVKWLKG